MDVPLVDLRAQQAEIMDEIGPVILDKLRSAAFIGGADVSNFENSYAEFVGVKHCIGVANGTDAVELALRAAGVGLGDEVIMPANTFIATAEAASRIGAVPVPVDVDPQSLLISAHSVAAAITDRTRAIVPVHLFGQVAPIEELSDLAEAAGIAIVEDGAQSQGAQRMGRQAGSLGLVSATSFYPGKNLGASGDAGAVTTDDDEIAESIRIMGNHGSARKYRHDVVGMNSRLDSIHAVTLNAKLARLGRWNELRREAASRYALLLEDLSEVQAPTSLAYNEDVWHLYVVRVAERDRVLSELNAAGIGASVHYPDPWHLTPAYSELGYEPGRCPVAEVAAEEILSLPMYPHLTEEQQQEVVTQLKIAVTTRR